jgi:hypothetical protein
MAVRRFLLGVAALALAVLIAGCAAGPNPVQDSGAEAGFLLGLWHGFISPIAFIVSLFNHQVGIYEVHNNGGWYNFGFVFGASLFFGGGGGAGAKAARRR